MSINDNAVVFRQQIIDCAFPSSLRWLRVIDDDDEDDDDDDDIGCI